MPLYPNGEGFPELDLLYYEKGGAAQIGNITVIYRSW